jgi:hypothetical protein
MGEIPVGLCQCGCGQATTVAAKTDRTYGYVKGVPKAYACGHTSRRRKVNCANKWRYFVTANRKAHVVIAEAVMGKPLPATAEVHHVDGDGLNNAHRNLVICQDKTYHKLLHFRARVLRAGGNPNTDKLCSTCRRVLPLESFTKRQKNTAHGRCYNCRECHSAWARAAYRRRKAA